MAQVADLSRGESSAAALLALLILWLGFFPASALQMMDRSIEGVVPATSVLISISEVGSK
ncbi:MAG TPA: hypothetical protein HPP65_09630 [Gammaproteobacteria bacterium]|nr:hypothetical protein [Gammaproteobacteria bacterium]